MSDLSLQGIRSKFRNLGLLNDDELSTLMVHVLRASEATRLSVDEILEYIDRDVEKEMGRA
jgi:hypothetical protein